VKRASKKERVSRSTNDRSFQGSRPAADAHKEKCPFCVPSSYANSLGRCDGGGDEERW